MEWLNDLAAELPVRRNDEPPDLRTRIVKEVGDHLRCSFERELQLSGDEAEAIRRVLAKFGDPARLVRKLWFEAMWGKIMSQRVLMGLCGVMTAACLGMIAFTWKIADQATEATRTVLDQSRAANEAMLERSRAWQEALVLKLDSRSESPSRTNDPEWVRLKIKLTKDAPEGPPADGYQIGLIGGSATNVLKLTEKSGTDGSLDCGLVRAGVYQMILETPWKESMNRQFYVRAGKPDYTIDVVCPSEPPRRFEGVPEINWPECPKEIGELGIVLTWSPAVARNVAGQIWELQDLQGIPKTYLIKTGGSVSWIVSDQSVLRSFETHARQSPSFFNGQRVEGLPYVGPSYYSLRGVVIFPASSNSLANLLRAKDSERQAAQHEVDSTGTHRVRISLPDELVARVRMKIAKLVEKDAISEALPDEQPF